MGLMMIGGMMFLGGMYLVIALGWWILQIVANWRIFTKAGQAGWKSIIPVYSDYISYKIAWQTSYFWQTLILGIVASCIGAANADGDSVMLAMIVSVLRAIIAIISVLYSIKLARAFGRGTGFGIGLALLPPVFLLILGLGDDRYYGADK